MTAAEDRERVGKLFAAIDAKNAEQFAAFLADDARFSFGNAPPVVGRAAIAAAVGDFFGSVKGLEHSVSRVIRDGTTLVCLGEVSYTRHDDRVVTLPFADVLEERGSAFGDYRIYIDIGPLYAD